MSNQLFFSHTWRPDKEGRDNHDRVRQLVHRIHKKGWGTWFDEYNMVGNIDASMAAGIDNCECVIVCLTETYCLKINETARNPRKRDNCHKEWNYACNRDKLMIPIIMEPYMLDTSKWPAGVVPLYLGSTLYLDMSNDDKYDKCIFELDEMLKHYSLIPKIIPRPLIKRTNTSSFRDSFVTRVNSLSKIYLNNDSVDIKKTRSYSWPSKKRLSEIKL
jgi:hypothetical protein